MIITDRIPVVDTGQGFTTTYSHKVYTNREGVPCPVLCFLTKGHLNERRVYQLLDDTKGLVITSIGKEGKIRYVSNTITTYGTWNIDDLQDKCKSVMTARKIAQEVFSWKSGRECHFPPLTKMITPEIYDVEKIPKYLHHPGMEGGFLLSGGGKGERNGNLFISKKWKLSMPHASEWRTPSQLLIKPDDELVIEDCSIKVTGDDVVFIEKETGDHNFLLSTVDGRETTVILKANGTEVSARVGGRFRCGLIVTQKGDIR